MTENKTKKSYYKRYQTKLRRRREGKTDYKHRRNMVRQDANKYGIMKARLVVRVTNSRVICQIVKAHVNGDKVIAYADSTELKKYGINFGLTNYSAAYATGLLVACRHLKQRNLNEDFAAKVCDGEYEIIEDLDDTRAVQCFLDIGLKKSSKGAKVFSAMKGASDGGIRIPHSPKKFPGYNDETEEFDSKTLRDKLFGKVLSSYMIELRSSDAEKYKKVFSKYIQLGINPEEIEGIYESAFNMIIENPEKETTEDKDYSSFSQYKVKKISAEERKSKVQDKFNAVAADQ